jgi:uncharacterized protein (DUF2141 family)
MTFATSKLLLPVLLLPAAAALNLLVAVAAGAAQEAPAQETAASAAAPVQVTFTGITAPTGALYIGLYADEASFGGGAPLQGFKLDVTGAQVTQSISGLQPGSYAVKVYHDIDGDGRMNTNAFGIPLEPYAASNNAPSRMGPPAWSDAKFEVTADGATQLITIP